MCLVFSMTSCSEVPSSPQKSVEIEMLKREQSVELLEDRTFQSDDKWTFYGELNRNSEGLIISPKDFASQYVRVDPRREYILTLSAKCFDVVTKGRLQVNWMLENADQINVSLQPFTCESEFSEFSVQLSPPREAVFGAIFIAVQEEAKLIVKNASFKTYNNKE